jgi:hypothetical protein
LLLLHTFPPCISFCLCTAKRLKLSGKEVEAVIGSRREEVDPYLAWLLLVKNKRLAERLV